MTFQELKDRCATRFRDPDKIVVSDAVWGKHVNAAYDDFNRQAQWPFLIKLKQTTVEAATRRVLLDPTGGVGDGAIKAVYDATNDRNLVPVPASDELPPRDRMLLAHQVTNPFFYELVGDDLFILPAPAAQITVDVYHFEDPPALSLAGDEPVFPRRYHEALVLGALVHSHLDDQNPEFAQLYRAEFDRIVQTAKTDLIENITKAGG